MVQLSWRGIESLCAWEERKGVLHAFMPAKPARWGASVTSPALATRRGVHALRLHWLHARHERRHERQSSDTVECGTAAHLNLIKKMVIDVLRGPVWIGPVGAARTVLGSSERHPLPSFPRGIRVHIFRAATLLLFAAERLEWIKIARLQRPPRRRARHRLRDSGPH